MDLEERLHNKGVMMLRQRLVAKDYYDIVLTNPTYRVKDFIGELDVIAIKDNTLHYYEVKLRHTKSAAKCAKKQYNRVCEAFPHMKIKGIYVPLDCWHIKRLHHYEKVRGNEPAGNTVTRYTPT